MLEVSKPNGSPPVPRAERIARMNDQLRKTGQGGTIMVTRGVRTLAGFSRDKLLAALAAYEGFDEDNDPHGERDLGDIDLWGAELLWKVEYFSPDMQFASNDPADPGITQRVLTVLLAEEY